MAEVTSQGVLSQQNRYASEGDIAVGLLVREINHARTWQQVNEAASAIFHVRLMQVRLEEESTRGGGYVSNWVPFPAEAQSKSEER